MCSGGCFNILLDHWGLDSRLFQTTLAYESSSRIYRHRARYSPICKDDLYRCPSYTQVLVFMWLEVDNMLQKLNLLLEFT